MSRPERGDALDRLVAAGWERSSDGRCCTLGGGPWQPSLVAAPYGMPAIRGKHRGLPSLALIPSEDANDDDGEPYESRVTICDTVEDLVELALGVQPDFETTAREADEMMAQIDDDETELAGIVAAGGGMPAAHAVALGWHDYAQALILTTAAMRVACGDGDADHRPALSGAEIVAACEQASRWTLPLLRDVLALDGREDLFDSVAAAASERLAHHLAGECDTGTLADAVTAPWRDGGSVPHETFVAALRAAAPSDDRQPNATQAAAVATALWAVVTPGPRHTDCDDDFCGDDLDAVDECLQWHAAAAVSITPRRHAELLADAAIESYHALLHIERARRRVTAAAHAAAEEEDLAGVELALEAMATECDTAHAMGWAFLTVWLGRLERHTSPASAAAIVRAAGDLWRSTLDREHEETVIGRMQEQFGAAPETAATATAELRAFGRDWSQSQMDIIRSGYGVKTGGRAQRRRNQRKGRP